MKGNRLVNAIMSVCLVPGFDRQRLISGAKLCPEKLMGYSKVDAYLTMLEEIYNFKRAAKNLTGLKSMALAATRGRRGADAEAA